MKKYWFLLYIILFAFVFTLLINARVPVTSFEAKIASNFNLNYFWIKTIGTLLGIVATYVFYLYSKNILATLIFGFSPLLIRVSFTDSIQILLLIVFILILKYWSFKKLVIIFLCIFFALLWGKKTIYPDLLPKSYTYLIDRRLSFDFIYESPLIVGNINFNRIVHNKVFYAFDILSKKMIEPFNFEKLVSPWQSQTILQIDGGVSRNLNSFYFWEIPLIFFGFLLTAKLDTKHKGALYSGVVLSLIFKDSIIFLLPSIAIFESVVVKKFIKPAMLLYGISFIMLIDFTIKHQNYWVNENDWMQYKIWESVTDADIRKNKIIMTDRFGDPDYYFKFYKGFDPQEFNIEFRSFDFIMEEKKSGQIWIGKGADFREKTNGYKIVRI